MSARFKEPDCPSRIIIHHNFNGQNFDERESCNKAFSHNIMLKTQENKCFKKNVVQGSPTLPPAYLKEGTGKPCAWQNMASPLPSARVYCNSLACSDTWGGPLEMPAAPTTSNVSVLPTSMPRVPAPDCLLPTRRRHLLLVSCQTLMPCSPVPAFYRRHPTFVSYPLCPVHLYPPSTAYLERSHRG